MQPMAPSQAPAPPAPPQIPATGLQANASIQRDKLTRFEIISIVVTICSAIALGILAKISYDQPQPWRYCLAFSLGALGGLIHEIAHSGGKILFFERKLDGFYMGGLAGMILGAIAGLLSVHGLSAESDPSEIGYQTFLAGLGLKGIVDAASSQPVPPGAQSLTTEQVLAASQAINTPQQSQKPSVLGLPAPPSQVPQ